MDSILLDDRDRLDIILEEIRELARKEDLKTSDDLREVYNLIDGKFLNGMPCDRVNEIVDMDMNNLTWVMHEDIHSKYWKGLDGEIYYKIKNSFINALLEDSEIEFLELANNSYSLKRI